MGSRILLVEDDPRLGALMESQLRAAGHTPSWVRDGADMPGSIVGFDLIILDLMLPTTYGIDLLKRIRAESDLPVLIVTARDDSGEKVRALRLGADDYVTKPFWPEEFLERVRARLRRPRMERADEIRVGSVLLELGARRVLLAGEPVPCTPSEFEILLTLCRRPGAAISRTWLTEHTLASEGHGDERTLDVHVSRLRKKLGKQRIETVWGIGYRIIVLEGDGT